MGASARAQGLRLKAQGLLGSTTCTSSPGTPASSSRRAAQSVEKGVCESGLRKDASTRAENRSRVTVSPAVCVTAV